jgi:hypothetical protein
LIRKKINGMYLGNNPTNILKRYQINIKSKVIELLKNESISDLRSIKVDNKLYSVTNTCTFDSIVKIMYSSYVNSDIYAK